jgi:hypothetical protein
MDSIRIKEKNMAGTDGNSADYSTYLARRKQLEQTPEGRAQLQAEDAQYYQDSVQRMNEGNAARSGGWLDSHLSGMVDKSPAAFLALVGADAAGLFGDGGVSSGVTPSTFSGSSVPAVGAEGLSPLTFPTVGAGEIAGAGTPFAFGGAAVPASTYVGAGASPISASQAGTLSGLPTASPTLPSAATAAGGSPMSSLSSYLTPSNINTALKLGGAVAGLAGGSSSAGNQTTTTQSNLDPRIASILFGNNNNGLLSQFQSYLGQKQGAGSAALGANADASLGVNSAADMSAVRQGAYGLLGGQQAPTMQAAQNSFYNPVMAAQSALPNSMQAAQVANSPAYQATTAQGSSVAMPSQGNLDLSGAYNSFINGESGNNPYLTGAIQKGINQSNNAFSNMTQDATQAVQDALASIRGGAISSGQYGGSRQGLAESRSIGDLSKNLTRAASQYGQNNTDAAVAAQAGQYNNDQQMKLNALNTLSGQQFGAAQQNAQLAQQNAQFNSGLLSDASKTNAAMQNANNTNNAQMQQQANQTNYTSALNNNQYNAGNQQQANLTNNASLLNNSQFNTGLQQQANQQNLGSQLQTNALNSSNAINGMNQLNNQLNTNYQLANDSNNYGINNAAKVSGLLSPYIGVNQSNTQSTPLYQNKTANILGGLTLGTQLANTFGGSLSNLFGSSSSTVPSNSLLSAFGTSY